MELIESCDNVDNVDKMLEELQSTNKEKYSEIINLLEKCHQKYLENENENKSKKESAKNMALKCFDKSNFSKNEELRKLFDDFQILDFVKYTAGSDSNVVQNIVMILGKLRFEIVFHGKLRMHTINEYKGTLNVCIQQNITKYSSVRQITGSANNVAYKIGQPMAFMVPTSKPDQTILVTRDSYNATLDNEFFDEMNFKLTSRLMFCYFIDFVLSDLIFCII